jgi:hypothetical protein
MSDFSSVPLPAVHIATLLTSSLFSLQTLAFTLARVSPKHADDLAEIRYIAGERMTKEYNVAVGTVDVVPSAIQYTCRPLILERTTQTSYTFSIFELVLHYSLSGIRLMRKRSKEHARGGRKYGNAQPRLRSRMISVSDRRHVSSRLSA